MGIHIQKNFSLKSFNTFGIDVKARYLVQVTGVQDLYELLMDEAFKTIPKLMLGSGSNILFTRNFPGLVLQMAIEGIEKVKEDDRYVWIKAGAGVNWHTLVVYCIDHGYAGIENLSLIPGTVGAAPMQNIGAYGVEIKEVFEALEALEISTGALKVFDQAACTFGYRDSIFKNTLKGKYIVLSVTLRLQKQPLFRTEYGAIKATLEAMHVKELSIKAISDAIIRIRQCKLPDPKQMGNAGSFFKNPEINTTNFERLQAVYPTIPGYKHGQAKVKIPAAWLIEQCGWKGQRRDKVGVHDRQALILVNYKKAKGTEIKQLALDIQASVAHKFDIELVPEVHII
ncbi:MAG: UDP-N-acetylmuramate dehydrogenase [Cytophagales bacterium]|nr:UDP-N-acetylmuramate dehydrogenase [Cytophagales bacterium]